VKPLLFIDCETTGTEPGDDAGEIVELAIVGYDGGVLFNRKILPTHIETASSEALEINGYDADVWAKEGVHFSEIAEEVFSLVEDGLIVGQHVTFDTEFLKYEIRRSKIEANVDRISYHVIDIASLISYCLVPPLEKFSLYLACEHFGISNDGAHTALADAQRARAVYLRLEEMKPKLPLSHRFPNLRIGSLYERMGGRPESALVRQFQKDYAALSNEKREAMSLRKGDRFSYPGSFKIYEAQSDAMPDERIEGKVVLLVTDHGLRDNMPTRLDALLLCTVYEPAPSLSLCDPLGNWS